MEIYGYSERGAMNALFYGMALDKENGEEAMKKFIKDLAEIEGEFSDFELFAEFSLSDFGDPDMMIIATNENSKKVVFFIEAKASCCKNYKLSNQKEQHDEYIKDGNKYKDGHSSNLFFQLRLKHYFFEVLRHFYGENPKLLEEEQNKFFKNDFFYGNETINNRLKQSRGRNRKIGENVIVEKMVKKIKEDCEKAFYIAIIPKQDKDNTSSSDYGFQIQFVTWEKIYEKFKNYVGKTIEFNQSENAGKGKTKSQILNNL